MQNDKVLLGALYWVLLQPVNADLYIYGLVKLIFMMTRTARLTPDGRAEVNPIGHYLGEG